MCITLASASVKLTEGLGLPPTLLLLGSAVYAIYPADFISCFENQVNFMSWIEHQLLLLFNAFIASVNYTLLSYLFPEVGGGGKYQSQFKKTHGLLFLFC